MDDATYEAQKERIRALTDKWIGDLWLKYWHLQIEYRRDDFPSERGGAEGWSVIGKCDSKWEYMRARLEFAMPQIQDLDDDDLELHFVHECCHILVAEMRHVTKDYHEHEERVVSGLARAFRTVREAGIAEGKRLALAEPPIGGGAVREVA